VNPALQNTNVAKPPVNSAAPIKAGQQKLPVRANPVGLPNAQVKPTQAPGVNPQIPKPAGPAQLPPFLKPTVRNPYAVPQKIPTLNPVRGPRGPAGPNPKQTLQPAKPTQKLKLRSSLRPKIPLKTVSLESQVKKYLKPGTVLLNRNRRIRPEKPITQPPNLPPTANPIANPPSTPSKPINPNSAQIISSIEKLIKPPQSPPKQYAANQPKTLAAYELYSDSVPNSTIFLWELENFEGKKIPNIKIKRLDSATSGGIGQKTGACAYKGEPKTCTYRAAFYA
jgi:hypothetical protein